MSKKVVDAFQPKITRNDRFAQMSHQEKVIEQKKKEIQLKLEAKQKANTEIKAATAAASKQQTKSIQPKTQDTKKSPTGGFNVFSNDGSFLDQFKQMKDKKFESKLKSFKSKDGYSEDRTNRSSRWVTRRRSSSPKERSQKHRVSRFSDKAPSFEPKITINTSFNTALAVQSFDLQPQQPIITPQIVTGQPLLKNLLSTVPPLSFPTVIQSSEPVIAAPPVLLNVPPPQIVPVSQLNNTLVISAAPQNVLVTASANIIQTAAVLTTVTLPPPTILATQPVSTPNAVIPVPPPCLPSVELSSIPPPNPIQVQNIPQPEPINALNIPPPAPIQVQNIPTPSSIQLNEIPNPKPLDLMAIPTPNDDQSMSDTDFIKNVPPPNKSVPPPSLQEATQSSLVQLTPNLIQQPSQCITQNITVQNVPSAQSVLVHSVPPPTQIQAISQATATFSSVTVALPVGVVQTNTAPTGISAIPSLMAQPILPPPGMGGVANVNVNCPPPLLTMHSGAAGLQPAPPPAFVRQPPPLSTNQMPPMNIPPPSANLNNLLSATGAGFKDINTGTPDYEAMASLARMVAQCGSSIEDVVRQRKNQDPSHWFLFHKESSAYQQYLQLVEQFKQQEVEEEKQLAAKYQPEDMYEPEQAISDDFDMIRSSEMGNDEKNDCNLDIVGNKRKRKSRWGDKDTTIPPPAVVVYGAPSDSAPTNVVSIISAISNNVHQAPMMLSKVTRTDPALVQYAINTFGSANLTEEDWKKAEDHYKINLLYQDMVKKREEVERLKLAGKNKYDYDSDEETDGGTWEHRLRDKEMMATQLWAQELTRQAEGKHHIGDFLPPEEMKRFLEKSTAAKEGRQPNFSDYKEFKIKEDNIGFKMLQKLGWSEGQGLGSSGSGIVEPVNKAATRDHNQGLGLNQTDEGEDEYESYRKRMMLAYRFRPNPLNNPRRPYY